MGKTVVENMHAADLKRAMEIHAKIEQARQKAEEARNLLKEAAHLASVDTYQGVRVHDQQDIRDIESVIRIAVTRPLNHLIPRWIDIVHGRQKPYS